MSLLWVDVVIVAAVGLSVLTGLFRGFVKEFVALCVWIMGIWLGFHYSQALDPKLSTYIEDPSIRTAVAFVLILFATLLVGGILNATLSFILKRAGLSGTDRTLGMVFGFIRGVFIVALIMVAAKMTSLPYEEYSKKSQLYPRFDPLVLLIDSHLPELIKQMKTVDPSKDQLIDTVPVT